MSELHLQGMSPSEAAALAQQDRGAGLGRWRWVGVVALGVLLLAGLAGLIWQTTVTDAAPRQRLRDHLRELRQMDAELSLNVLRARSDLDKNYDTLAALRQSIGGTGQALADEVARLDDAGLKSSVQALRDALAAKLEQVENFKTENAVLRNSLRFFPTSVLALREHAGKTDALLPVTNEVMSLVFRFHLAPDEALKTRITTLLGTMEAAIIEGDSMGDALRLTVDHGRAILEQKGREIEVLNAMAAVPTGVVLDGLGTSLDRWFVVQDEQQSLWSQVLAGYAAALLVLLVWVGWKLLASHRALNAANASLGRSNEMLELWVQERTRALSEALEHLKESQIQLVQSEKMASLGQMVAGIAHEINTPLAYINSSLQVAQARMADLQSLVSESAALMQLMGSEQSDPAELEAQFGKVHELVSAFEDTGAMAELDDLLGDGLHGIEQIREMVVNLKDFSRLDRSKVAQFNINDGVMSTLKIARNLIKHKEVKTTLGELPLIECSPSQINQVLLNLVTNACHATPENGGRIEVFTEARPEGVLIEVTDNGSGIPPDVLPRIFDPFFTTKKVGEGTGLGLSIVQRIVKEHGGRIDVVSTLGLGTKFTVVLPLSMPHAPVGAPLAA